MQYENETSVLKTLFDIGFGHAVTDQFEAAKAAGKQKATLVFEVGKEKGEMSYQADIAFGKTRIFFNGYRATHYAGLKLDDELAIVDLRALAARIQNPPNESMVMAVNKSEFEKASRQHLQEIIADMEKLKFHHPEAFMAMMARYQVPEMPLDNRMRDEMSEYAMKNFRSRFFPLDEKVTLDESYLMLSDPDSPRAVRKNLQEPKPIAELIKEWEAAAGVASRMELTAKWEIEELRAFKKYHDESQISKKDAEKNFYREDLTLGRFRQFLSRAIKEQGDISIEFNRTVPTWLVIDFTGRRTSNGNLPILRIPDEKNYLAELLPKLDVPLFSKETGVKDTIRILGQGQERLLMTGNDQYPKIVLTANPRFQQVTIRDPFFDRFISPKKLLKHDLGRAKEGPEPAKNPKASVPNADHAEDAKLSAGEKKNSPPGEKNESKRGNSQTPKTNKHREFAPVKKGSSKKKGL